MRKWDGKERREMNQDQIERDRLLTEVHSDIKYITAWIKNHEESDDLRFSELTGKTDLFTKFTYTGIGGLAVLNICLHFFFK